jgi:hypothetical protein
LSEKVEEEKNGARIFSKLFGEKLPNCCGRMSVRERNRKLTGEKGNAEFELSTDDNQGYGKGTVLGFTGCSTPLTN